MSDKSPCRSPFYALLSRLIGEEGDSLNLSVTVTESAEVAALRQTVKDLNERLNKLQSEYNRLEYLYRCETLVNLQIIDIAREEGVNIPKRLKDHKSDIGRLE